MQQNSIIKAHKIRLNPTPEQAEYFHKAAGVARRAWNWALGEYNKRKADGQKVKIKGKGDCLKKEFTAKKYNGELPWLAEVTSYAYQRAFDDLSTAISTYFDRKKKGELVPPDGWKGRNDGKPFGWPRFKAKYKTTPSFYLANNGCMKFDGHWVKIQKCPGLVNMTELLRFNNPTDKIMSGKVTYHANHWWLSVQVEVEQEIPEPDNNDIVGIDLGVKYLAVTSDGVVYDNPKPLIRAQKKLRRLQRKLDRQRRANNPDNYNENGTAKKGPKEWHWSSNMRKTQRQINQLHYRVTCLRNETAHKMTTEIAENYAVIGVEDLNVKGMVKNKRLAKQVSDAAFYEKRRQLTYKANWNGGTVVAIDRWFPSSKRCNSCGSINAELEQGDRQWMCQECGQANHRDGNAALNIRDEAERILISSPDYSTETLNAHDVNT